MDLALYRVSLLLLVYLLLTSATALGAEKALVFGTPTANLRVGPSIEQPIIITLKEGDAVMVERLDGEWYQVTAPEGQKGFINKNLLKFAEGQKPAAAPTKGSEIKEGIKPPVLPNAPAPAAAPEKGAKAPATPASATPAAAPALVPTTPVAKGPEPFKVTGNAAPAKSRPLIDLVAGREMETAIWLGVALLTFVLGWICGGIHSMRRERVKRSRLLY